MVVVTPHAIVAALAGLSSLALATAGLVIGRPGWITRSFAAGMVMFSLESFATMALLGGVEAPRGQVFWLNVREVTRILAPLAWLVFVSAITRDHAAPLPAIWRRRLTVASAMAVALSGAVVTLGGVQHSIIPAPFEQMTLTGIGLLSAIFQILLTVAVMAGLEACLRSSRGTSRRRIKFLVLGLGGVFAVRFYLLSQTLLLRSLDAASLSIATATFLVADIVIAVSLARTRLPESQLSVSRSVVYRSVVVGILGGYLLVVGGLGWLLNYLQIPETAFWVPMVVFVSALCLTAVLLSEQARWRLKRFIALNFYRSKYDYREQWIAFTRRLGPLLTIADLTPQLLERVAEAVGSDAAMVYIADDRSRHYHLAGSLGVRSSPPSIDPDSPLLASMAEGPLVLDSALDWGGDVAEAFSEGSVIVPLGWPGHRTGFLVVGPERAGMPYTPEDLEFMSTVGQQATGSIVAAKLSEDLARSREFDAFARVSSFVIHDLKNMTTSLSLLSQNAVKYLDEPDFQKDTIRTLARTVERMQGLLTRLSSRAEPVAQDSRLVDLASVVQDALAGVAIPGSIKVVTDLESVAPILGDPEALSRVVQNLVTNAVQAMDGGGTIAVAVKPGTGSTVLSVADTGCGMAEDFIRHSLFVPFRSTKRGGWGIGLYQVKEIVDRHGGTFVVTSKEGVGTTFEIALPVASP